MPAPPMRQAGAAATGPVAGLGAVLRGRASIRTTGHATLRSMPARSRSTGDLVDDDEIVRVLGAAVPDLVAVYRFGSTAAGVARRDSDVDLGLLARQPLDPAGRFELQEELALRLHRDVDLVDLRRASTVMRMQILAHGTVIAEIDAAERARFETYTYSAYARLNEERRTVIDRVRRERTVHGR